MLAGAGAGKTKTITSRIVDLIRGGVSPEAILALTFTNKTAREMRDRVRIAIADETSLHRPISEMENPFVSTFHALSAFLIREHAERLGLSRHFSIYDRADSKQAVKEAMSLVGIDPKEMEPGQILSVISREKGNLQTPSGLLAQSDTYRSNLLAQIWERYEMILKCSHALDFDDLLSVTVGMLSKHADIRARYQDKWKYLHVDEYQDTNRAQYELLRLLAETHKEIFAVGDIDQTIYTWRGARIKNLLHFEKDYPGTTVVLLEENYRSSKTILEAANAVIRKNKIRYEKNLFTKKSAGEPIGIYGAYDEADEALFVTQKVKALLKQGTEAKEIAVLYRANFQSRALEQAFLKAQIPYQVLGTRFFERKEVKDVLSFIRVALNPQSSGDLRRVINVPPRGIGKLTFLKMLAGKEAELNAGLKQKVSAFRYLLASIREVALSKKPSETVKFVITQTGLEKLLAHGTEEELERLENMRELATVATLYDTMPPQEGIEKLLADVALASEQDEIKEEHDAVRLMTVHASKGLEFDCVFVTGLEQDLFPHLRREEAQDNEEAEEERRLFYVALTRARDKVFLSYAQVRTIFGARQVNLPSEFLSDIEEVSWQPEVNLGKSFKTIRFD